jgi:hypothetical protein
MITGHIAVFCDMLRNFIKDITLLQELIIDCGYIGHADGAFITSHADTPEILSLEPGGCGMSSGVFRLSPEQIDTVVSMLTTIRHLRLVVDESWFIRKQHGAGCITPDFSAIIHGTLVT